MEVLLISEDERLFKLCSDVLNDWHRDQWSLSTAAVFPKDSHFDLYIWDCDPDDCIPARAELRGTGKHLFLVHRTDLPWFRSVIGPHDETILLKPVTRATLSTFLLPSIADREHSRAAAQPGVHADRDDLFQSLIEANLRLQEYDQERTNFIARAVHDFRAPLTAISGYCGLFLDGSLGTLDEQQREVLLRVQHSAQRLFRLSSAMFDLSVSAHVERREALVRADIRQCVTHAVDMLEPVLQDKSIKIDVDLQDPGPALYLEPGQIEQVVVNLLDNAAKFTPRRGAIQIRGYATFWEKRFNGRQDAGRSERRQTPCGDPNCYRLDVRDNGPGVPAEHINRIFEEYAQLSGEDDRSSAGLGLAICRMILSRHDGRIWAESSGEGAVFSFVLPFRAHEAPVETVAGELLGTACIA